MKNPYVRWAVYIAVALAVVSGAALGTAYVMLSRLDVRAEIERAVERGAGRDLTIKGDVSVTVFPVLGLTAEEAALANVPGGVAPALASVAKLTVSVELRPLLFRREIVVRSLRLHGPRIALEVDAAGKPNWLLAPAPPPPDARAPSPAPHEGPAPAPAPAETLSLRAIEIRDGALSYADARTSQHWSAEALNFDSALTSLDAPVSMRGNLVYKERPVGFELSADAPRAMIAAKPTPVHARIRSELLNATVDGEMNGAAGAFAGAVNAEGPSLRRLLSWAVAPAPDGYGLEAFTVNGKLTSGAEGRLGFEDASFTLDALRGRGDFELQERGARPYVSGRLELFETDINPYLAKAAAPAAAPSASEAGQGQQDPTEAAAAPSRGVDAGVAPSTAPLDFSGLKALNADLELTVGPLKVQQMTIDRAQMSVVVNDGYLAATLHSVRLYGGTGRGRFELDAREPAVRLVQEFVGDGLNARAFLTDAIGLTQLEGRTEVNIALASQGRDQDSLIKALDGRISVEVVSGALHGVDLGGVATTIRRALNNQLIAPTAQTRLTGMSATFWIRDGVMASDSLSFNTPDLRLRGLGIIDLGGRTLDMRIAPIGSILAIPFRVHGPWTGFAYASDFSGEARDALAPRVAAIKAAR
jgi:AsmA protein